MHTDTLNQSSAPHQQKIKKTGVLIVNLGTPDSPSVPDVRRYLREFLMDERVIDIPYINRWFLINMIIAPFRAPKSAKVYKEVWTKDGSPLKIYGYSVEEKLQKVLGDDYVVKLAMRYQNPSIEKSLNELQKEYGHVSAIIQGMDDCQEIYDGICNLAHENIQIFNGLNLSIFEKFAWASQSDAFICVAGAGMTFLVWFADVPGVAHSEHAHLDHVPWWLDARPNALPVFTPDKSQIEEVGSGWYCNYNVDWKILLDLLRKALQIRRERS